jgi:hypothetical protein
MPKGMGRWIVAQGHPWAKNTSSYPNESLKGLGVAHVVEHLPTKLKNLSSNPDPSKKKKGSIVK